MSRDYVGTLEDVRCGEPEQANPLREQQVLSAIVIGQVVTMPIAVVLDSEPCLLVPNVDAANLRTSSVTDPVLHFWPWTSTLEQNHSQHGLHQRLRFGLRQLDHVARLDDAPPAAPSADERLKLISTHEPGVQKGVGRGHCLYQRQLPRQIEAGSQRSSGGETVEQGDVA